MNKSKYLLPVGFRDLLPPEAEAEFYCTYEIIKTFQNWGYRLVATPMVEFEDSLFDGSGKALEGKALKLFDPASQKVMGVRADITTQISRLFSARLNSEQPPIRLCYAGNILRQQSANTRGDRELKQVGIELIDNSPNPKADAEIVIVTVDALLNAGLKNITIDLNTPKLIEKMGINLSPEQLKKLEKRDSNGLPTEVVDLLNASGNAASAFKKVKPTTQIDYVKEVFSEITKTGLKINLTADFIENKGFEYHDLFSFSVFAQGVRDELGRGGRYNIINSENKNFSACGATIYINSFIDKITPSAGTNIEQNQTLDDYTAIKKLHAEGKIATKKLN